MKAPHVGLMVLLPSVLLLLGTQATVAGPKGRPAVAGQPTVAPLQPGDLSPGLLAYVRPDSSGVNVLYFANSDGTHERAIRVAISKVVDWSPSGRFLAVADVSGVTVLGADGTQVGTVVGTHPAHYAWSPVADLLLVETEQPPADMGLALYTPQGELVRSLQAPRRVTTLYNEPSWSPDGNEILLPGCVGCNGTDFDALPSTVRHLWLARTDGGPAQQSTSRNDVLEDGPQWSPDGSRILFFERCTFAKACPPDAFNGTFVMNRDGSHRHLMVDGYEAHWSPDGRHLAFLRDEYVGSEVSPIAGDLYVGNATGKHASRIAHGPTFPWAIGWSRDSRRVFYEDDLGTWSVNSDGSDPISIVGADGVAQQFTTPGGETVRPPLLSRIPVLPLRVPPRDLVLPAEAPRASSDFSSGSLVFDAAGNLYVSDCSAARIYRVIDAHTLAVVVGSGPGGFDAGFGGDGGQATHAEIYCPFGLAFDSAGDLVLSDHGNSRIRTVSPYGVIRTIAGTGHPTVGWGSYGGDGGPAVQANLAAPTAIAYGSDGSLYIADRDNDRIRAVSPAGIITTYAGTTGGFNGDGGPAVNAQLDDAAGIAIAPDGALYFADSNNERIRKITSDGIISTVAGTGKNASSGDGGPAIKASLADPEGLLMDSKGNLYVSESEGNRVRVITPDGTIHAFAGTGASGDAGDGGPATQATLDAVGDPGGLAVDALGTVYISTVDRIRAVDSSGVISTYLYGHP